MFVEDQSYLLHTYCALCFIDESWEKFDMGYTILCNTNTKVVLIIGPPEQSPKM